jgi:hypothetical protein
MEIVFDKMQYIMDPPTRIRFHILKSELYWEK